MKLIHSLWTFSYLPKKFICSETDSLAPNISKSDEEIHKFWNQFSLWTFSNLPKKFTRSETDLFSLNIFKFIEEAHKFWNKFTLSEYFQIYRKSSQVLKQIYFLWILSCLPKKFTSFETNLLSPNISKFAETVHNFSKPFYSIMIDHLFWNICYFFIWSTNPWIFEINLKTRCRPTDRATAVWAFFIIFFQFNQFA
jgi:hypothetical protein